VSARVTPPVSRAHRFGLCFRLVALGTGKPMAQTTVVRVWCPPTHAPPPGDAKPCGTSRSYPAPPQIQRDAGRALRPLVVLAVAARAIVERRVSGTALGVPLNNGEILT
jgi:hypothetical protein